MAKKERQFTDADLYGADGRPHAADIHQDRLFDCYFVAPMGALSEQQPDRIRDAIRFDPASGDFTVTLYRPPNAEEKGKGQTGPIQESVVVSQEDIRRNITKGGGGTADNNNDRSGPLWPTVLEAGFAELYGRNSKGEVNLEKGYRTIGDFTGGGSLADGVYALTGESGRSLQITSPDAPPLKATGPDHVKPSEPPPYRAPSPGAKLTLDAAYTEVEQALAAGKPVSMATQGRDVPDGLEESHAYMVLSVSRDPKTNEALVTLRNPYGKNERAQEGDHNIGTGWKDSNPVITVSLNQLVRYGSFAEFNIGPAPRVQAQPQAAPEAATPGQPAPASPATLTPANGTPAPVAPTPLSLSDPRNPDCADHRLYKQLETCVARIDAEKGHTFDATSERMTIGALPDVKAAGITSPDYVAINDTGKRQPDGTQIAAGTLLFVVQGQDPSDPAARRSVTDVAQVIERPVEQSLQKLDAMNQQQAQGLPQTPNAPQQDEPARAMRM